MQKKILVAFALALCAGLDAPHTYAALTSDAVSKAVRVFFKDAPIMVEVARCESGLRQYTDSGSVLRGGWSNRMIGLFQLHETYHRAEALSRGYDIDTLIGNMAYARDLYRSEGTTPWNSSAHCWRSATVRVSPAHTEVGTTTPVQVGATLALASTSVDRITETLKYGMTHPEVRLLQRVLNREGYQITRLGAETDYFGIATYRALVRFQCDRALACKTIPGSSAQIGRTESKTREVINTLLSSAG